MHCPKCYGISCGKQNGLLPRRCPNGRMNTSFVRELIKIYLSSWFTTFARTDVRHRFMMRSIFFSRRAECFIGRWVLRSTKQPSSTGAGKKTRMNVACGTARCHSRTTLHVNKNPNTFPEVQLVGHVFVNYEHSNIQNN